MSFIFRNYLILKSYIFKIWLKKKQLISIHLYIYILYLLRKYGAIGSHYIAKYEAKCSFKAGQKHFFKGPILYPLLDLYVFIQDSSEAASSE